MGIDGMYFGSGIGVIGGSTGIIIGVEGVPASANDRSDW